MGEIDPADGVGGDVSAIDPQGHQWQREGEDDFSGLGVGDNELLFADGPVLLPIPVVGGEFDLQTLVVDLMVLFRQGDDRFVEVSVSNVFAELAGG